MRRVILILLSGLLSAGCSMLGGDDGVISSCQGTLTDSRDGQVYALVEIGEQCWMRDVLKIGSIKEFNARNSTHVSEDPYLPKDDGIIEKYCGADLEECREDIGYWYTWDEAMDYSTKEGAQGICPNGWHIPSEEDWEYVEKELEKQQRFTPEKNLNDYFGFANGRQWEWTSTSLEMDIEGENFHSVRVHRILGGGRDDRFGVTVRENKYYVRCMQS